MSEPQGQVAGRLSVIVEASLAGFARELKRKVEEKSKGVKAQVGVELNDKGFKEAVEAKVKEAAAGVKAEVGVDLDAADLKAKVEAAAKAAGATTTVNVDADTTKAEAQTQGFLARIKTMFSRARADVAVRAKDEGVVSDVMKAKAKAQAAASAGGGVRIPVKTEADGRFPMRMLFRGGVIFSLVSLLEPAVGAIGQIVAGLTAMVGAAAPAVGVLQAIPVSISAGVQAMATGKIIAQGFGDALGLIAQAETAVANGSKMSQTQIDKLNQALGEMSPSARRAAFAIVGLRKPWTDMRKQVQERFFSQIAGDIEPLAKTWLPLLATRLGATAEVMGSAAHATAQWAQTKQAQADTGKVMAANNGLLSDFLYMVGQFGKGSLDILVSSRRFERGFGGTLRSLGDWFSGKAADGRKSGGIEDFLDRATDKASQLWHITTELGGGLGGIFRAGTGTGDDLLDKFDHFLTNWHEWVDSPKGQEYLKDWFRGAEDGFIEASRLINDAFKGMAKWAADPKIEHLLHQLRTELGPALSDFLKGLSDDAAPMVIDFLTQLTRTIDHLEPGIEIASKLTSALVGLVDVLNDLADVNPGVTTKVAQILGGLMLVGSVGRVGKLGGLLAGGAAAGKKGGLLARILGGGAETAAVAAGVGATATNAGKLGKALGPLSKFGKMGLLKKAGYVGLFLTALDAAGALKDAATFGNDFADAVTDGYAKGANTPRAREKFAAAFKAMLTGGDKSLDAGDVVFGDGTSTPDALKNFNIDVKHLATEMQTLGSKSPYLKRVKEQLEGISNSWKHGPWADMTSWVPGYDSKGEQARDLLHVLGTVADKTDEAIAGAEKQVWDRPQRMLARLDLAKRLHLDIDKAALRKRIKAAILAAMDATGHGAPFEVPFDVQPKPDVKPPRIKPPIIDTFKAPGTGPTPLPTKVEPPFKLPQATDMFKAADKAAHVAAGNIAALADGPLVKVRRSTLSWGSAANSAAQQATDGFNKAKGAVESIPKTWDTKVTADTGAALSVIDRIKNAVTSIPRTWSTTYFVNQVNSINKRGAGGADGDPNTPAAYGTTVPKTGKPYADRHPYLLADGEEVVSNSRGQADRYRGLLKAINAGARITWRRLAGGGTAGPGGEWGHLLDQLHANGSGSSGSSSSGSSSSSSAASSSTKHKLSKSLRTLGAWIAGEFRKGIEGGVKAVKRVENGLWERLTDRKYSAERIRAMKARFADEFKAIKQAAEKRDALNDRLTRAQNKLQRLRNERATFKSTLKDSAEEYGDIGSIAQANGGFANVSWMIGELKDRAKKSKLFRKIINRLRRKGLSKYALQQIIDLGMEDGLPVAQQLVQGSAEQIKKINRLQGIIRDQAKKLGKETSKALWDSGIKAAQAIVHQLKARQRELNRIARHMADALIKQLRSAVGLPNKKKKDGGKPNPKPKTGGGGGAGPALRLAGQRSSARTSTTTGAVNRDDDDSPRPKGGGSAPLVGALHLTVGDKGSVRDAMDETMFALRRIRQGGLYADHVA